MGYNDDEDDDSLENEYNETFNALLIFAKSIGFLLHRNEGLVIELEGDMYNPIGDSNKVVIYYRDDEVVIDQYVGECKDGEFVDVIDETTMLN